MKQMQCTCNELNIKTNAKQVWLYFICRTMRPGYMGTTTNLQIVLNTQECPYLNSSHTKNTSYPQKSRNRKFQTQKILLSSPSISDPCHLKSGVPLGDEYHPGDEYSLGMSTPGDEYPRDEYPLGMSNPWG